MRSPTLHLLCGLPGSGKSTLAVELEAQHQALRLSPDAWLMRILGQPHNEQARRQIEGIQWELAQKALALGVSVVLDFGFWHREERDLFRKVARSLGAKVQIHYLQHSQSELMRRLEKRNANLPADGFYVDPSALDEWSNTFEAPTAEELE